MPTIERTVVLGSRDANGNETIYYPVTKLKNIDGNAEVKDTPKSADYVPVIDMEDGGKMKKTSLLSVAGNAPIVSISVSEYEALSDEEKQSEKIWNISDRKAIQLLDGSPVGTVINFMGTVAPQGYLICDGAELNIGDYRELSALFESQFGSKNYFGGDGETTFALPDLRGEFIRGSGTNSHSKQGNGSNVGKHQDGTMHVRFGYNVANGDLYLERSLTNGFLISDNADKWANVSASANTGVSFMRTSTYNITSTSSSVTSYYTSRPTNTSVLFCIKYTTIAEVI